MKKKIIPYLFCTFFQFYTQAQLIDKNDTLHLNYSIASGEFGVKNEGLMIYFKNNELHAMSIKYNSTFTDFAIDAITDFYKNEGSDPSIFYLNWDSHIKQRDSLYTSTIINFYKKNMENYTIVKNEWILSNEQCEYIANILNEIMTKSIETNIFSNASEDYAVISKNISYVFIDRRGNWNKYLEIKKVLEID